MITAQAATGEQTLNYRTRPLTGDRLPPVTTHAFSFAPGCLLSVSRSEIARFLRLEGPFLLLPITTASNEEMHLVRQRIQS
jgi:hypothetical protein